MESHISGLKCDNPKCNWANTSIPLNEYPNWVEKKCPICGEEKTAVKVNFDGTGNIDLKKENRNYEKT